MNEWVDQIEDIHTQDQQMGSRWYWITITPTMSLYNALVPLTERPLDTARLSNEDYIAATNRKTARETKLAIQDTLQVIDPRCSRHHPESIGDRSRLAARLIPALRLRETRLGTRIRQLHYHGWIVLNPPRRPLATTAPPDNVSPLRICSEDTPTTIYVPEPVALLGARLKDAFGSNINLSERSETDDTLRAHLGYATRTTGTEITFPNEQIMQPGWFWKPRMTTFAHALPPTVNPLETHSR